MLVNATLEKRAERLSRPSAACLCHIYIAGLHFLCQQVLTITAFVTADVRNSHYSLSRVHYNNLLGSLELSSDINCAMFSRIKYHSSNSCHPRPQESTQRSLYGRDPQSLCARWSYFAGGPGTTETPLSALCALRFLHCGLLSTVL